MNLRHTFAFSYVITNSSTKYIFVNLPTRFHGIKQEEKQFNTKIINFNCELFLLSMKQIKQLNLRHYQQSYLVFNKENKHYTILKRNLNKDRIEIDSLTYHITKKCNFINDFDKVYLLLLEIL